MKTLSLLVVLATAYSFAQVQSVKRLEFDLKDGYNNETIYEFGKNGFVLFANSDSQSGEVQWKFDKYDNDLNFQKTLELTLPKGYYRDDSYLDDQDLYLLLKNRKGNFSIVHYNAELNSLSTIDGEVKSGTSIRNMAVLNDLAYFVAVRSKINYLLTVDLKTGEQALEPIAIEGINSRKLQLKNFEVQKQNNEVIIMLSEYVNKRESNMYVVRTDKNGIQKDYTNFSENAEYRINDLTASALNQNDYVYSGTFSAKGKTTSTGLYFSVIDDGKIKSLNYYNFVDLENFLSYLPERTQERIEKKKSKKESRGKELQISYWLAPHNIIQTDDGYIFLAEAYYPTYRQEARTTTTYVNGVARTTTTYVQVFDGYQYTHAFLAKFDKNGNLVWDQCFKMWMAYKPYYVKRFIKIADQQQDAIKLVFSSSNRIASKSFSFDGEILSDYSSEIIESNLDGDKAKYSYSNISFWYDNYFIAYGSQTIKNKQEEKKKRKVYFINKIQF